LSYADPLFDAVPDRRGRNGLKWGKYEDSDVLPLWVADMDFRSPPEVIHAAEEYVKHGNYGYGKPSRKLPELVCERMEALYGWEISPKWIVWLPGMVCGFNAACRATGQEGDEILSCIPVYPPFLSAPGNFGQQVIQVPMKESQGRYGLDFETMEQAVSQKSRTFLFCHPHNPVGTVFSKSELQKFGEFCLRHEITACSDEIHCDLLLDEDCSHIPLASVSDEIAENTITLMAPSKTFNIPGFGCSFAIIQNPSLRIKFKKACAGIIPDPPAMGFTLAEAAYRHGEPWRKRLTSYLRGNRDLAFEFLNRMPGLKPFLPSATYLLWIDARELGTNDPHSFFEKGGVGLSNGADFGTPGFLRLNFGCTRDLLEQALQRMEVAIGELS